MPSVSFLCFVVDVVVVVVVVVFSIESLLYTRRIQLGA